jgi:hypothetical protein
MRLVREVVDWMNVKSGGRVPKEAFDGNPFDMLEAGPQRATAVRLVEPRYWACRFDDPDARVAARTWVTEVGIGQLDNGDVLFGCKLLCCSRGDPGWYARSVPLFVRKALGRIGAVLDGVDVSLEPRVVNTPDRLEALVDLLCHESRRSDVVVLATEEGSEDAANTLLDARRLQERLVGVAHVFVVTSSSSFDLSMLVGRHLSVFRQAVRVYKPGFSAGMDEPQRHPLFLAEGRRSWRGRSAALHELLIEQALAQTTRLQGHDDDWPSFAMVNGMAAAATRKRLLLEGGSDKELLAAFEKENAGLRREIEEQRREFEALLQLAESERDAAMSDAEGAKAKAADRMYRIRALEARSVGSDGSFDEIPIPESIDELEDWCKEFLSGRVEVLRRAVQAAKKSAFKDVGLIYRALLLLRDRYVPMRREPSRESVQVFQEGLNELGLEEQATGDGPKYAKNDYTVVYGGVRRPLERHLKGSNSRDRRFGFRLYFFYDEEEEVVVVGHLPEHLDNKGT